MTTTTAPVEALREVLLYFRDYIREKNAAIDVCDFLAAQQVHKLEDIERRARAALTASPATDELPADAVELVIASRIVVFEDKSPDAIDRLERASEAFASRVPWDDEPEPECDCQCPEPANGVAGISETCPIHNTRPEPATDVLGSVQRYTPNAWGNMLRDDDGNWISFDNAEAALNIALLSQQSEINRLREVVEPFAAVADEYADQEDDDFLVWKDWDVLGALKNLALRHFRRARAALPKARS